MVLNLIECIDSRGSLIEDGRAKDAAFEGVLSR